MSRSVIKHKNPRGKLIHPSQGQELESAGRFTDQTKNSISSKKCEKVLYVTVIYTTKIAYLPEDDTGGTGHTQVYESRENMLDSKSISENQSESDMDLIEDISSDDEIYSDIGDGEYFSAVESLEETLEIEPLSTSGPCTVVSF